MPLEITDISRSFGRFPALKQVSLTAADGEFLALLGPSGSGKTTLLRILAGLETPDEGSVVFEGEDFLKLTPRQRRVGLVFQHYALFRHMTVARNIGFGLRVRPRKERPARGVIAQTVQGLLNLVQLDGLGDRYPAQLSGGQRQRVALARALAIEPRILLLDEPFGALDAKVRRDLRRWLRRVHDETGVTTVFVTHDQEEALDLADRVAVLRDGRLEQVDTPQTLYDHPASAFVHGFLGASIHLAGTVAGEIITVDGWSGPAPGAADGAALLCIRPEDLSSGEEGLAAEIVIGRPPRFARSGRTDGGGARPRSRPARRRSSGRRQARRSGSPDAPEVPRLSSLRTTARDVRTSLNPINYIEYGDRHEPQDRPFSGRRARLAAGGARRRRCLDASGRRRRFRSPDPDRQLALPLRESRKPVSTRSDRRGPAGDAADAAVGQARPVAGDGGGGTGRFAGLEGRLRIGRHQLRDRYARHLAGLCRVRNAGPVRRRGAKATTRLGRFKLDLGSRRLVAVSGYPQLTTTFTGAAVDWSRGDSRVSAFYALPVTRLPGDKPALLDNEHEWDDQSGDLRFWGAFYGRNNLSGTTGLEAFLYGLEEQDSVDVPTRNRDLLTVGGRLFRDPKAGQWDFEVEGGYQSGTSRASTSGADVADLDVEAGYAHLEVGYRFDRPWSPRVALEYDYASGDKDPTDDEYNRFDALYGSRTGDFGPSGLYGPLGRANISSPGVRVEVAPNSRWDGFVFYRALWLAEARDSFSNTSVRDASGASGDYAGTQFEVKARYWVVPRVVRLEVSGAVLFADDFLETAPNATGLGDSLYGAIDLTYAF